ncbi:MAG: magnesium/cobalt transporter CorA [candidate division KSB1 bacterium]|nr:magnesium/cobalt transporter CorA [candidate division KSB1 bacterium]MDZ7333760.1 magnesium/cobalt transporter CorA [candidate division KSB1 bacterium]MDZ7358634.1 magnesium/cobalt transporter CorA [candidate division KSB1 bacterium]MDZ7400520.1 magnesium/cobalt transporter CorA [candidate division KSB1 bacterium]
MNIDDETKRSSAKIGLPPGSLVYIGEKKTEQTRIEFIGYNDHEVFRKTADNIEQCFFWKEQFDVVWINIDGLHEVDVIERVGKHFNIHALVLEDILHPRQRPKAEDFGKYFYVVVRSLNYDPSQELLEEDQVSLLFGLDYVISFQEQPGDELDPVRDRIASGRFQLKKRKADFVAYSLIDAVVDNYFLILENIGEKIEWLEDELLDHPSRETLQSIHQLKTNLIQLRKSVWPLREVIGTLQRSESNLLRKSTMVYLKDIYDHTIEVIDTIETYRDMVSAMLDIYLSNLSNKMNEVMKMLTIIATIFIPLTFIAGVYGMNFEYMPELRWRWGYFIIWGIMIVIGFGMVFYFRRKKWL